MEETREQVRELQGKLVATKQALRIAEKDLEFQREKFRDAMEDESNLQLLVGGVGKKRGMT